MSTTPRILSIGQCYPDHFRLAHILKSALSAQVEGADTAEEARALVAAHTYDLVLINRVLDADGTSGIALIPQIRAAATPAPPVMLVSNYPEAQAQAMAAGALPGFGKSELAAPQTLALLRRAMANSSTA